MFNIQIKDSDFKKSSFSKIGLHDQCVSIAKTDVGVAIRDTKDNTKQTLYFSHDEWNAFILGAKAGEFD